ncbi:MAG: SGNH/GDSL hydrolase family protein [Isosphaeraceae bacterium]|nr:SGNH/GDSL hydrolase family protein [Isosphaeraceae bacterium]
MTHPRNVRALVVIGAMIASSTTASAGFQSTYLALGDSLAFGTGRDQSPADVNNGDRGYVKGFANMLSTLHGGNRPTVINLAIPGEDTASYLGTLPNDQSPFAYTLNTNYPLASPPSQRAFALDKIASQAAAGFPVEAITLHLGSNDLFRLARSAAFQTASSTDQQAMIGAMFNQFATSYASIVGELRVAAPAAQITLLGYYDPFAPYRSLTTDPRFLFAQFAQGTIPILNSLIAQVAAGVPGATFIDLYPLFVGREKALTYVDDPDGNVHPNAQGYAVITGALATVPEPSSMLTMIVGLGSALGVAIARRRSRTA